jgi:hypothetical protein
MRGTGRQVSATRRTPSCRPRRPRRAQGSGAARRRRGSCARPSPSRAGCTPRAGSPRRNRSLCRRRKAMGKKSQDRAGRPATGTPRTTRPMTAATPTMAPDASHGRTIAAVRATSPATEASQPRPPASRDGVEVVVVAPAGGAAVVVIGRRAGSRADRGREPSTSARDTGHGSASPVRPPRRAGKRAQVGPGVLPSVCRWARLSVARGRRCAGPG